jgi:hypothetical protein
MKNTDKLAGEKKAGELYKKAESTKFLFFIPAEACTITKPDAFVEILFYLVTDFFSSQLHDEDTFIIYLFPNFSQGCFAPVLHLVMHIA